MHSTARSEVLSLAGYPVLSTSLAELCETLQLRLQAHQKTALVFANTNFVIQCQRLRQWLSGGEVFIVNDGIGMDIAALLRHGKRFQANLNGTDFIPLLLRSLSVEHKIFLLGGKPGVAELAAEAIERQTEQCVVGCADGYTLRDPADLRARINASGADIVLVAMGNPLQEEWIAQHMHALDASLLVSVGALFDFLSGGAKRAPQWVQAIRFEWLYRLTREPRRLAQRYTVDLARFLVLCMRYPRTRSVETAASV